ncbi:hypothetical protein CEXT_27821 [Caerostris extrusa]|uniref:Uncharacterized protein n=1 Tax=Caerostris extrusa TaxID=172846 RepID=A0AAV4U9R8_CAEEX|nr:hypothetical protein CEXT_27821 [Caerostris extrusa]
MRTSRKDQQRPYSTGDPFCHGDPFSKATLAPFNDCPDAVPRASIHLEPPRSGESRVGLRGSMIKRRVSKWVWKRKSLDDLEEEWCNMPSYPVPFDSCSMVIFFQYPIQSAGK